MRTQPDAETSVRISRSPRYWGVALRPQAVNESTPTVDLAPMMPTAASAQAAFGVWADIDCPEETLRPCRLAPT